MTPAPENPDPESEEGDRVTRVGRILRRAHLEEIPQLGTILLGQMSVVGTLATWRTEEVHLEARSLEWHKRWFIKPGLTGLAQIRNATSADPQAKLRADLEYIRRQSLSFDVKIVLRQIWGVVTDVIEVVGPGEKDEESVVEPADGADAGEDDPERERVVGKAQD